MNLRRTNFVLLLAFVESFVASTAAAIEPRPNIVLIMTDDQGWGDLGVHGNPIIETPNLDALAGQSARLNHFYVSPVCAPTRASLMTGRWNYRTRAIDTYVGRAMMEPDEVTIAEMLRDAGYATGIFGKWHLGDCAPMRPQDQGFEEVLVHRGGGIGQPSDPPGGERKYTNPVLFHNGERYEATGYCTDVYFNHAAEWIAVEHAAGRPFFAYIATNCPHGPWDDAPNDLVEKYAALDLAPVLLGDKKKESADRVARGYAMIENIDANVGRFLEALDATGAADDTIVIFMCDNGPYSRRYVGDMRGTKGQVYEGGIRSPFFVRWPARLQPGVKSSRPAAHVDVTPTLLAAAGVEAPNGVKLDGKNILPLLEGDDADWPERALFLQWHRGDAPDLYRHFAVRRGRWKLVQPKWTWEQETPDELRRIDGARIPPLELYDLVADPHEEKNLVKEHAGVAESLLQEYVLWFGDVSATRPDNYAPPRILLGSPAEPTTVLTKQDWRTGGKDGWGKTGTWLVTLAGEDARTCDVTVRIKGENDNDAAPPDAARLALTIGGETFERLLPSDGSPIAFERVSLPPGEFGITALIKDGAGWSPHQVVVSAVE